MGLTIKMKVKDEEVEPNSPWPGIYFTLASSGSLKGRCLGWHQRLNSRADILADVDQQ